MFLRAAATREGGPTPRVPRREGTMAADASPSDEELVERRQAKFEAMGAWREVAETRLRGEVPAGA